MLFYPLDRTGGSHLPTSPLTPVPSPLYLLPDIFRYTASYLLGVVTYIIHRGYQTPTSLSLYSVKTPTKANRRPFMTFDLTDPLTLRWSFTQLSPILSSQFINKTLRIGRGDQIGSLAVRLHAGAWDGDETSTTTEKVGGASSSLSSLLLSSHISFSLLLIL